MLSYRKTYRIDHVVSGMKNKINWPVLGVCIANTFIIFESILLTLTIRNGMMTWVLTANDSVSARERDYWIVNGFLSPMRDICRHLIIFLGPLAVLIITIQLFREKISIRFRLFLEVFSSYVIPAILCLPSYFASKQYDFGDSDYYPYILFGCIATLISVLLSLLFTFVCKHFKSAQ